jgi:tight adherence protein C
MEILVAIGTFGLVWSFAFLFLAPKTVSVTDVVQQRLQTIAATAERLSGDIRLLNPNAPKSLWEWTAKFFWGTDDLLAEKYTAMRQLLHLAGYTGERAIHIFWGVRIFLALAFAAGAYLLTVLSLAPVLNVLLVVAVGVGVGYILPLLYVRRKAQFQAREMQETFPDTLDLFVVCVEAGLGVDAALVRVANEQAQQGLAIGREFQLLAREMQAGIPRREALARMADRLNLDELRSLSVFLIQTEELGGSIAHTLRVYASTMRHKRIQKAEEAVRKMVIKLLLPMVFFIMPALFFVIFSPLVMNIMQIFASPPGK